MTARVYSSADWFHARVRRATAGRAPRLAIRRYIYIRPQPDGRWAACIAEWRFGKWKPPEWLCGAVTFDDARSAAIDAWRKHRLPIMWNTGKDSYLHPFELASPSALLKKGNRHVV